MNNRNALSQLFPSVSAADWQPFQQRYAAAFSGPDTWHNHFGCYLLRSQGQTILVDTGVGSNTTNPGMVGALGAQDGGLMTELGSLGVKPEDVNTVFFTHLHPDHVGWNLMEAGGSQLQFANARYLAHQSARLDQFESLRGVLHRYLLRYRVGRMRALLTPEDLFQIIFNSGGRIGYLWQSRWRHGYFNANPIYLAESHQGNFRPRSAR